MSKVVVEDGMATLIINSPKHGEFRVLLDEDDAERVSEHQWWLSAKVKDRTYFCTEVVRLDNKSKSLYLHRFLMNAPVNAIVDHKIPTKTLDNRKYNLRLCTIQENQMNKRSNRGESSSKFKGVTWNKNHEKWCARIQINGRTSQLGDFRSELEAAKAYDNAARELFGEFAYLNFPTLMVA